MSPTMTLNSGYNFSKKSFQHFKKKQALDPKERFEKELSQFINEKKFERVKKETEEYKYPPILHV